MPSSSSTGRACTISARPPRAHVAAMSEPPSDALSSLRAHASLAHASNERTLSRLASPVLWAPLNASPSHAPPPRTSPTRASFARSPPTDASPERTSMRATSITRSARAISAGSWVISAIPICDSWARRENRSRNPARALGSSCAVGSSSTRYEGCMARAPARAIRCCCPPDNSVVTQSANDNMPTRSRAARTRLSTSASSRPKLRGPKATSSKTRDETIWSTGSWHTRPTKARTRKRSSSLTEGS